MFDISTYIYDDQEEQEEYAKLYYREVKGCDDDSFEDLWFNDPKGFPSLKEVVLGLWNIQCQKIEETMQNAPANMKREIKDSYKWAFMFMILSIDFDDVERPLTKEDFKDPNGKVVSIIMYIHSMEPPFYAELNKACRTLDVS